MTTGSWENLGDYMLENIMCPIFIFFTWFVLPVALQNRLSVDLDAG